MRSAIHIALIIYCAAELANAGLRAAELDTSKPDLAPSAKTLSGASSASSTPKPIPQTRPDMKRAIEALKQREPRLPLPPVEPSERDDLRSVVNNGRMRKTYLPPNWTPNFPKIPISSGDNKPGGLPRMPSDPAMTLDDTFKVRLFWIVSRSNNCYYCLGHQEHKLRSAGMAEDEIATLDSDWRIFPIEEQRAMKFTRQLTLAPHEIKDESIEALRRQYTDAQWVELVQTVSSYNSTNRWTDSLGIPQDERFGEHGIKLDTPTSEKFVDVRTRVLNAPPSERPPLETGAALKAALDRCRAREPRCQLLSDDDAREVVGENWPAGSTPGWLRALALLPKTANNMATSVNAVRTTGRIPGLLKAQIAWTTARQNRAWYAALDARSRLIELGADARAIEALDGALAEMSAGDRAALKFARKLTSRPQTIADRDIAELREHFEDAEVAEIVYVVCMSNWFDRLTESLRLPADEV